MKILCSYQQYDKEEVEEFILTSKPTKDNNFTLEKGREEYGWVDFYFKHNNSLFKITLTLATSDLEEIVMFFEGLINLKEDIVIFLDDECISEPLLYASSIDENNIRLLIADGKTITDKWKNDEINEEEIKLSKYEIKCDVIIDKKQLLKEFYRAVKNIIDNFEENEIYSIGYNRWKDNLKNIILYCKKRNDK